MKTSKRKPRIMWEVYHMLTGYTVNPRPFVLKKQALEWNKSDHYRWWENSARKVIVTEAKP